MWEVFLMGFAYLDAGLTILATYFTLPVVLVCLGVIYLYRQCVKFVAKRRAQ